MPTGLGAQAQPDHGVIGLEVQRGHLAQQPAVELDVGGAGFVERIELLSLFIRFLSLLQTGSGGLECVLMGFKLLFDDPQFALGLGFGEAPFLSSTQVKSGSLECFARRVRGCACYREHRTHCIHRLAAISPLHANHTCRKWTDGADECLLFYAGID
ncbi:hypothetical protein D3C87_1585620 [compost metagenome]